jgi:outer membrane protein
MKNSLLLIVFLLALFYTAHSQDVWSLEKCIQHAQENNITVKQQVLQERNAQIEYKSSKQNLLPDLNFSANNNYSFGRTVDPFTNTFTTDKSNSINFGLSSSVTIFDGLKNYNTIESRKLNLLATVANTEKIKNDISLSLANAYLQILFAEELYKNSQNQLEVTKLQLERTQKLVEAGKLPQGNYFDVQAQFANEELQVITNENSLRAARLSLIQMLDLKYSPNFAIDRPNFSEIENLPNLPSADEIFNSALRLPQIKSAEYQVQNAQTNLSLVKGAISPTLSIGANYGTGYSSERKLYDENMIPYNYPMNDQFTDNQSFQISVRLIIPIFNRFSTSNSIKKSQVSILQSQYSLETEKQTLYKDIQSALNSAYSAQAKYIGTKKALEALNESFKYTEQKFELGLVNSLDYSVAKNNLVEAESNLLQAKYELIFTLTVIDFYMGKPIQLNR